MRMGVEKKDKFYTRPGFRAERLVSGLAADLSLSILEVCHSTPASQCDYSPLSRQAQRRPQ